MASACRERGTLCGRRIFIFSTGIDQIALSTSISVHSAWRSSPGRTNRCGDNLSAMRVTERHARDRLTVVSVDGLEKDPDLVRINDRRVVRRPRRGQGAPQVGGNIAVAARRRDAIAEHPAEHAAHAAGTLITTVRLDLAQDGKGLVRRDAVNRMRSDQRVGHAQEPPDLVEGGFGAAFAFTLGHPSWATSLNEVAVANFAVTWARFFSRTGSRPAASALRASSRRTRASAKLISGQGPICKVFCVPR